MRQRLFWLVPLAIGLLIQPRLQGQARPQEPVRDLRIDPMLLVSVKEYRNVLETIGPQIYPGWKWNTVPLLLYRPNVQDVLLNAPHRPPGFADFTGRTVLPDKIIYARNDSTERNTDGQNTSLTLDSMQVLVVADQYSRERADIETNAKLSTMAKYLKDWGFIQSAYDEVEIILHEAFHVHQARLAPGKYANEAAVAHYPVMDASNNALVALETRILRDAVLAKEAAQRRARIEQYLAVRTLRRAGLDTSSVSYENLNEFTEGTAKYVQLRFEQLGERVTPVPEMYLRPGFTGYRGGVLARRLEDQMNDMVKVASFSDDRFGNKFGGGPLRWRLYSSGAAQALLLDEVAPDWKQRIFAPGVYLTDLLAAAIPLSTDQRARLVAQSKAEYGYDSIFVNRQALEAEGRRLIQQRVDSILGTSKTLVTISYAPVGEKIGMGYTPFGVTAVTDHSAIYDLVPVAVRFANKVVLRMKSVVPLLVDRGARTVTFAVEAPPSAFEGMGAAGLDLAEFTLSGSASTTIAISGNKVRIELK
jgi:hypothetical protein